MQAVIIAGGKGARLRERLGGLPKPMAPVGGRPLLEHQILLARHYGFTDIVLLTGYGAQYVREYFGNGERWGVEVRYCEEPDPLGTAGAVLANLAGLQERFLVMYGDTMLNVHLQRFWEAHAASSAATLFLHPNDHPQDSDLVELDAAGRVAVFHPCPHAAGKYYANLVNAALYVIDRKALEPYASPASFPDFGKHLFPHLLREGLRLGGYRSPEYIKDAGTPERLDTVIAAYESGRIALGSLATPAPAVFLDRDGTLNREVSHVKAPSELEVLPGTASAIRRLNEAGIRTVVITNQPVVARGECSEADLAEIHRKLETELGAGGAYLDAIYYCPHHPERGFAGERPELKFPCACRKPATGLVAQAVRDLNLDLARCWLIGDSSRDIATAAGAGIRSILVKTGHAGAGGVYRSAPDAVLPDLPQAVDFLLADRSRFEGYRKQP